MKKIVYLEQYGKGEKHKYYDRITGEYSFTETSVGGWKWAIEDEYGCVTNYKTDTDGCGLWRNGNQILGTCQYSTPKTRSGMYKRIKKRYCSDL